jgi:primosomal protein N' (replication factor Y)
MAVVWARRIIVQTRQPTHPAVQALVRWDAAGFWRGEAERRAELGYPPSRVLIHLDAADADAVAGAVGAALPDGDQLSGPDVDGRLLVKSSDPRGTLSALGPVRRTWSSDDVRVTVDVDPVPGHGRSGVEPGPARHS